jgi:hypothetical protein
LEAFFGETGAPSTSRSGHQPQNRCRKPHFAALNDSHNSIWHPGNDAVVEQIPANIIAHNLVPPKHDHIFKIRHPFKGRIAAQLERHPYTAQQLLQPLQSQGYAGGYSILKEFVRLVRPVRKPAFLMLEFAPGECAQVDWGSFGSIAVGSTRRRLSFFVMVLCHSRMMYVEFGLLEGMEHFLSCHRHAHNVWTNLFNSFPSSPGSLGVVGHKFVCSLSAMALPINWKKNCPCGQDDV